MSASNPVEDGSLAIEAFTRDVTSTTRDGTKTEPWGFTALTLRTAKGMLRIELDSGDWSKMLATPLAFVPARLSVPVATPRTVGAA